MKLVISLIIGLLFSSGVYMMLHRSFFKLILGVIIFSYAAILFLFVVNEPMRNAPPLISEMKSWHEQADPLPQALTLTAIVIGIGIQLFVITMLKKVFETTKTDDLDALNTTDQLPKNG